MGDIVLVILVGVLNSLKMCVSDICVEVSLDDRFSSVCIGENICMWYVEKVMSELIVIWLWMICYLL